MSRRVETTAYHEAGHAVASYDLGVKFRYVTITANEETHGHLRGFRLSRNTWQKREIGDLTLRDRDRIERDIMVFLAGPFAEKIHAGRFNHGGAAHDHRAACDLASVLGFDDPTGDVMGAYLKWMGVRTKKMMEHLWGDVDLVAKTLLENRRLSGPDVWHLIGADPRARRERLRAGSRASRET